MRVRKLRVKQFRNENVRAFPHTRSEKVRKSIIQTSYDEIYLDRRHYMEQNLFRIYVVICANVKWMERL